jgi:hypothetical protein
LRLAFLFLCKLVISACRKSVSFLILEATIFWVPKFPRAGQSTAFSLGQNCLRICAFKHRFLSADKACGLVSVMP